MTTYIIYADSNDGYLQSSNTNYTTAVAGSNLVMNNTATTVRVGQSKSPNTGTYWVYEGFWSFDTSVITDTEEIVDATINAHMGYSSNQSVFWDIEFRAHDWTAPLTTAQWKTRTTLATYPVRASFDIYSPSSAYKTVATGNDTLIQNISKTVATKFISVSSRHVAGNVPTGIEEMNLWSSNSTGKPYLTVYTVAPNTLNSVSEASTTLPDGTTVSLRSDGSASNIVSVGYTPLNSSTWTSLGQINASIQTFTDGQNALAITSDPAGNFYILGQRINTPGNLIGQAYKKTGPTTWVAQSPIEGPLPAGSGQTIRSIAAQYMKGGTDANDKPSIHVVLSRGASGIPMAWRYSHVSGSGYTQNAQIKPESLLAGTGKLINAANGFNPAASAIPAFVDMIPLGDSHTVSYVQRGKIHNTVVGGLAVVRTYNQSGAFTAHNLDYVATGASQLVSISDKMFAHVFDENSLKLTVRFYNTAAQVVGEVSVPKDSFYGGVIGTQFAAYYDKTSNVVRLYYVDVTSSRTLSRVDISPVTFEAVTNSAVITNLGPASSLNTDLRISRTSDERRVMIEAANNAAGVLSVATAYSTVGNIAPSAPVLTVRPNFDATSAASFTWKFGDANPADAQTAYQLEISRVSDSVVVHDTGKMISTSSTHTVAANVMANAVNYRWRVRTYDTLDTAGTWSDYGTFTTSATGTLTITSPSSDNLTGIETDDYLVEWSYVQAGGATQTQRRVRLIRTSDNTVLLDTGMQASTVPSYQITGMESGKTYRVEVTVINSAAITTPVVTRLISPYYSEPMTPTAEINIGDSFIEITVVNPAPTGDRPEVAFNDIYKRRTKAGSVDSDFVRIATVANSATYRDYAIKAGTSYDYYIIGRTV